MAAQSKLMPSREQVKKLVNAYTAHRPLIQRTILFGFVAHILTTTYLGLHTKSGTPSKGSRKGKGKQKATEASDGKKQRVSVSHSRLSNMVSCYIPRSLQIDAVFYQRLSTILRIVIPSLRSKEALLLVMHSSLLILRTVISLYVAALDGR